jgi:hypothetical protein
MKKIIAVAGLVLASLIGVGAQTPTSSQSNNEFSAAYSFVRQDLEIKSGVNPLIFVPEKDSHGVAVGYTRYLGGDANKAAVFGLSGELAAQWTGDDSYLVTALAGGTLKARNSKYVQPYARLLAGGARQNVKVSNALTLSDWSSAVDVGGGVDFNLGAYSRYKIGFGADYINTGFLGERQHNGRATVRLVF